MCVHAESPACSSTHSLADAYAANAPLPLPLNYLMCSAALAALAARSPLVEVGAGLGYWAGALRAAGVRVAAHDAAPPGARGPPNEYHGRVPAISQVPGSFSVPTLAPLRP